MDDIKKAQNIKQNRSMRRVRIDGVEYMKNTTTNKLYTMPRTVITRKILRNRLRTLLKTNRFPKVNTVMSTYWNNPKVQEELRKM